MSSKRPLYERDPDAYEAYLAKGNRTQARKRVAAKVLIRDRQDRILLVDPSYKPAWDLPGGMVELNEPPHVAAKREVKEELGLHVRATVLLLVDWVAPHGPWDDSLVLVFDGGVLSDDVVNALQPTSDEIERVDLFPATEMNGLLRGDVARRTHRALARITGSGIGYSAELRSNSRSGDSG